MQMFESLAQVMDEQDSQVDFGGLDMLNRRKIILKFAQQYPGLMERKYFLYFRSNTY